MLTQQEIRNQLKLKRNLLSDAEVQNLSDVIFKKITDLNLLDNNVFFVYKNFGNEVKTDKLINFLIASGKTVAHPLTTKSEMFAVKPTSTTFIKDKFGIEVPTDYEIVNDVEVAFIPLLACDLNKNRIGFGKGYYDKFLSNKNLLKIGLAYDFQVLNEIPSNDWDVKLDLIITDKRIIK